MMCAFLVPSFLWAEVPEIMKKCPSGSFCGDTVEAGAREGMCLVGGMAPGCASPAPFAPPYDKPITNKDEIAKARAACMAEQAKASNCCSRGEGCNEGLGIVGDRAGGGLKGGAGKEVKNHELAMAEYRRLRGRCYTFATSCAKKCEDIGKQIDSVRRRGGGGGCTPGGYCGGDASLTADLISAASDVSSLAQRCKEMDGKIPEYAEKEYEKGKGGAEDTETAAGGGGGPGGGGDPGGGAGEGGGSGFDPSSILGALSQMMNQPKEEKEPFQSQTCEENPNLAGCDICKTNPSLPQCLAKENWEKLGKSTTSGEEDSPSESSFNVGGSGSDFGAQGVNPSDRQPSPPVTVTPVANGGGGFVGGGGGGAQMGAQGGGGGGVAGRSNTDIMRGERGGGGGGMAALNSGMQLQSGSGGGFGGYGKGAAGQQMDLSQFLPGGAKDPTRRIAGQNAESVQINSREVNIWNRISERFRARCVAGRLKDCVP